MFGWHMCCLSLFDVRDKEKQKAAIVEMGEGRLEVRDYCPNGEETTPKPKQRDPDSDNENSSDEEKDVLDVMKARRHGTRQSKRKRKQPELLGYRLLSNQVDFADSDSEDSDANGMD